MLRPKRKAIGVPRKVVVAPRKVAVIGCGLVGGSIALALKDRPEVELTVFDTDPATVARLQGAGLPVATSAADAVHGAALVVLAVPTSSPMQTMIDLAPAFASGAVITDTCSVKGEPSIIADVLYRKRDDVHVVLGHPMAGKASAGFEHADADLFRGATWVVCNPHRNAAREANDGQHLADVVTFAQSLGARPVYVGIGAERHDRVVAAVSHVPQLIVTATAAQLAPLADRRDVVLEPELFERALRLAASPEPMWAEITRYNHSEIVQLLTDARRHLDDLRFATTSPGELAVALEEVRAVRDEVNRRFPDGAVAVGEDERVNQATRIAEMAGYAIVRAAGGTVFPEYQIVDRATDLAGRGFGDSTSLATQGIERLTTAAREADAATRSAYERAIDFVDGALKRAQLIVAEVHDRSGSDITVFRAGGSEVVTAQVDAPAFHAAFATAQRLARDVLTRGTEPVSRA
jgi:prephenate dehydrogenase